MALQLILGGSGAGKTTYLYDEVIRLSMEHPQEQYFLIVPEQFTMQTQKDIVTRHPNHGTMNIDIVSFARLAYRIFEELAVENLSVLDDMGKSMVLRKVAAAQKRQMVLFGGQLNKPGFVAVKIHAFRILPVRHYAGGSSGDGTFRQISAAAAETKRSGTGGAELSGIH